tara:strand:- start:1230 stop:1697 length:468 start_codon:yes stop_codon:yes gene_type:complete
MIDLNLFKLENLQKTIRLLVPEGIIKYDDDNLRHTVRCVVLDSCTGEDFTYSFIEVKSPEHDTPCYLIFAETKGNSEKSNAVLLYADSLVLLQSSIVVDAHVTLNEALLQNAQRLKRKDAKLESALATFDLDIDCIPDPNTMKNGFDFLQLPALL